MLGVRDPRASGGGIDAAASAWPYNAFANPAAAQHPPGNNPLRGNYSAPPPPTPLASGSGGSMLIRGVGLEKMAANRWRDSAAMDEIAAVFLEVRGCQGMLGKGRGEGKDGECGASNVKARKLIDATIAI